VRTTLLPLGCYEPARCASLEAMEAQILASSANPEEAEATPLPPD